MMSIIHILIIVLPVVFIGLAVTFIAKMCGLSPLIYWSIPVGAAIPWVISTLIVVVAASFVEGPGGQAAAMIGLFPIFAIFGFIFIGIIISFFIGPHIPAWPRFIWSMGVSAIPALLLTAYLLYVIFSEG